MKIEDYGYLSDLETGALVARDGSIDWWCVPRYDSAACFAKLLGNGGNGFWRIAPRTGGVAVRWRYVPETLVLESEFEDSGGRVRIIDFLAIREKGPLLSRMVEGVSGEVDLGMTVPLRCDHGRIQPWVQERDDALVMTCGPDAFVLRGSDPLHANREEIRHRFRISAGDRCDWALQWHPSHEEPPPPPDIEGALACTKAFWRGWSGHCDYQGEWRDAVAQSARVLKGLTYAPTGGIVAAPTTGLPERVGGTRNWDYRYCWLRDAALTLDAFLDAGYLEEARAWRDWLLRAIAGSPSITQIIYGVGGERRMPEFELPHLAGYEASRPVRAGNDATRQFQLDIYGQVLDTMFEARHAGVEAGRDSWRIQQELADFVAAHWNEKDEGIWEVRSGRRHFTHSKVLAWVALDRAIRSCGDQGLNGNLERWRRVRSEIHRHVCATAYDRSRGAFMLDDRGTHLDASLLIIPLVGFLPANDPRVRSTVETIECELMRDGFVYRYDPDRADEIDGLPPGEGAFLPCSFWMVDALNMIGRRDDAVELFERVLAVRSDLGLLSEEYEPVARRLLGNFPQAFSHVGLINSACNLTHQGRSREARGKE